MKQLSEHSPLGGSGAHRWMVCPGSVGLSEGIEDPTSEWAILGTAAHFLLEFCLNNKTEAWEYIDDFYFDEAIWDAEIESSSFSALRANLNVVVIDREMADAVQSCVNQINHMFPDQNQGNTWIEQPFHVPQLHDDYYSMSDFSHFQEEKRAFHVLDFKYGAGIVVEVQRNPQIMYYACGMLTFLDLWEKVDVVHLYIHQPRGWHSDGPHREWTIKIEDLEHWLNVELIPSMFRTQHSTETKSGSHCRFCPARQMACPQIIADFDELEILMEKMKEKGAKALSNDQLGRFLHLTSVAKIAEKAASQTAFGRLSNGKKIPGYKLVKSRANREWPPGSSIKLQRQFGEDAYTEPEIKSPAKIDQLKGGTEFTAKYAKKPEGGLVVASDDDNRKAIEKNLKQIFAEGTKT